MTDTGAGTLALGHIGITVSDLDLSEGFYQEVLGLRVIDESLQFPFRYAAMARGGRIVLTLWEHGGGRIARGGPGLHHLAFEVESVEEVNRTRELLDSLGARWTEGARLYPEGPRAAAIHFEDPDGIRIEVYSAGRPAESECGTARVAQPQLKGSRAPGNLRRNCFAGYELSVLPNRRGRTARCRGLHLGGANRGPR